MAKPKDSKGLNEYDILTYNKGFTAKRFINGNTISDYFQYKEIYNLVHHPNVGIEIIEYNGNRRIFYHDEDGDSVILFNLVKAKIQDWLQSNKN